MAYIIIMMAYIIIMRGPIKYASFCFTLAIGIIALNPEIQGGELEFEEGRGA